MEIEPIARDITSTPLRFVRNGSGQRRPTRVQSLSRRWEMDIMEDFNRTVDHIDASLSESADDREIRRLSGYSRAMFSRVLSIFTGMTLSEYICGRRLAEAAFDLRSSGKRVIDVALRHGFGSPDSFAAASKEFHGRTSSEVRDGRPFRAMSKLRLALSVRGGEEVKVSIQRKPTFTVAGLMREAIESSECPETNQLPGVHRTSRHMAPETCMQTATRWSCGRPSREHRGWSMRRTTPLTQPVATASRSLRVKPSPPPAYSYKLGDGLHSKQRSPARAL